MQTKRPRAFCFGIDVLVIRNLLSHIVFDSNNSDDDNYDLIRKVLKSKGFGCSHVPVRTSLPVRWTRSSTTDRSVTIVLSHRRVSCRCHIEEMLAAKLDSGADRWSVRLLELATITSITTKKTLPVERLDPLRRRQMLRDNCERPKGKACELVSPS